MKMTAMCTDANLTRAYQRGWSVYSNKDIPPPLRTNTHIHIRMENYQKQNQACETPLLCTSTRGRRQSWQHALPWMEKELLPKATEKETHTHAFTWNGPPLIQCFLFQNVIGNLILIKVFRAQAYIPTYKQKHAKTLTESNLKQPWELIYRNVYNTETQWELT